MVLFGCVTPLIGEGPNGEELERIAVKHLVPTTSPERIWMELDCLRVANGKDNVIPLLFGHRLDGDVILAMPFVHTMRFGDLIKDITMSEARQGTELSNSHGNS